MERPIKDKLPNAPKSAEPGEFCLLIITQVVCACGSSHIENSYVFQTDDGSYSHMLSSQRYEALIKGHMHVRGKRTHARLVPICHECRGMNVPETPTYYEAHPDKHLARLVDKARTLPTRTNEELRQMLEEDI